MTLPLAVYIESRLEDDGHGCETEKGHECHEQVGGGEEGPGLHGGVVTGGSIAVSQREERAVNRSRRYGKPSGWISSVVVGEE